MGREDVLGGLQQELRRGIIVLCTLRCLGKPMYGYNLVTELTGAGVAVEANTLYPLLRRLEGQGLLASSWETGGAKPRKYYRRTALGDEVYLALRAQWEETARHVGALLQKEEGDDNEQ